MAENLDDKNWVIIEISVPPELVTIGVAPDLQRFFDTMVYKLRRNAHKGRWEDVPLHSAFEALENETDELRASISNGSTTEILTEAADVANQALIVAAIGLEAKARTKPVYKPRPAQPGVLQPRDGFYAPPAPMPPEAPFNIELALKHRADLAKWLNDHPQHADQVAWADKENEFMIYARKTTMEPELAEWLNPIMGYVGPEAHVPPDHPFYPVGGGA